jgi:hypothetical protein
MSLLDCIKSAQQQGHISPDEAGALTKRFQQLSKSILAKGDVRLQMIAEIEAEAAERKRRVLLTETARAERMQDLYSYRDAKGRQDPAAALSYMLENEGQAKFGDVRNNQTAIIGMAQAEMEQALYDFRKGHISGDLKRRNGDVGASLANVVRESFGQATGDLKAQGFAGSFAKVSEDLRQRFNAAGGAIGKLDGWGLPQAHDAEALMHAGRENWVAAITPLLNEDKMIHPVTGFKMTRVELAESLNHIYETIVTDGWNTRDPSGSAGRGALYTQGADHRFLHFKDPDAWLKYQKQFGQGDVYATMMGHIGVMARDIAMMEQFGPNPDVVFQHLKQVVQKGASTVEATAMIRAEQLHALDGIRQKLGGADSDVIERLTAVQADLDQARRGSDAAAVSKLEGEVGELRRKVIGTLPETASVADLAAVNKIVDELRQPVVFAQKRNPVDYANGQLRTAQNIYDHLRGNATVPVNGFWAKSIGTARNLIGASSLGGAAITALGDLGTAAAARAYAGLPVSRTISDVVKQFNPANRREAVASGLILDSAMSALHEQVRFVGGLSGHEWSKFIADRVHSASGLAPFTQAEKHAFGMAIQRELAERAALSWQEMPGPLQRLLDRHGFDAAKWDALRKAELYEPASGATFLRPKEIAAAAGRDVAEQYLAMIYRETKYAVTEATTRSNAAFVGTNQPGTVTGELLRAAGQFKSFGIALVMLQGGRIMRDLASGQIARGAAYAGGFLTATTVMGALSVQLKELVQGRDPRKMIPDDAKGAAFWGAALLQGGGMGIYGDFLFSDVNRNGGSLARTLAGPMFDRLDNVRALTIGNVFQAAQGEKTHFGREAVNFLRQNTPGGTLWYARLAYERVFLDQLQHLVDPESHAAFRRKMEHRKREFGNEFWWRPGETNPARGPNLGAAGGTR